MYLFRFLHQYGNEEIIQKFSFTIIVSHLLTVIYNCIGSWWRFVKMSTVIEETFRILWQRFDQFIFIILLRFSIYCISFLSRSKIKFFICIKSTFTATDKCWSLSAFSRTDIKYVTLCYVFNHVTFYVFVCLFNFTEMYYAGK